MTRKAAIDKWLEGVTNAALEFRPLVYKTNAIPNKSEILKALQTLSRLTRFGGFIEDGIEELYAQQVTYAIEHMSRRAWSDAQCAAARDAITETLNVYLHYDPAIGNGVTYQTKCFHKTLRLVDQAYDNNRGKVIAAPTQIQLQQKAIPCCLTPYYKHTVIKDPNAQPTFKYKTTPENEDYARISHLVHKPEDLIIDESED